MKLSAMSRWIVFPGVLAGFLLHVFTCFYLPEGGPNGFTLGLFAVSILPYLACLIAGLSSARGALMAVCALVPVLLLDIAAFNEAIISPTTSTSALVLLVVPVFNLGVVVLGFLLGWITFALLRRNASERTL